MRFINLTDVVTGQNNNEILILRSFDDFYQWYTSRYDLSMFDEEAIKELLTEEKPSSYPCVPLLGLYDVETTYLSLSIFECNEW